MADLTLVLDTGTNKVKATASGAQGVTWTVVNSNTTMSADTAYLVDCTGGTRDMTLPATISAGNWFVVAAWGGSARVVRNGHTIEDIGAGNDLLIDAGETAYLVARSSSQLRIV